METLSNAQYHILLAYESADEIEKSRLESFISKNIKILRITRNEKIVQKWEEIGIEALEWPPYMGSAGRNRRSNLLNWIAFLVDSEDGLTTWIVPINDL